MSNDLLEQIARLEQHAQESEISRQQQRAERLEETNRKLQHQLKQSDEQVKQLKQLNPKRLQEQIKRLQKEKQQQQTDNQQLKKQLIDFKQRLRKAEQEAKENADQDDASSAENQAALIWSDDHFRVYEHSEANHFKIEDCNARLTRTVQVKEGELVIPKAKAITAAVRKQLIQLSEEQMDNKE